MPTHRTCYLLLRSMWQGFLESYGRTLCNFHSAFICVNFSSWSWELTTGYKIWFGFYKTNCLMFKTLVFLLDWFFILISKFVFCIYYNRWFRYVFYLGHYKGLDDLYPLVQLVCPFLCRLCVQVVILFSFDILTNFAYARSLID